MLGLLDILALVLVVGIVVGIIAYKPFRNKLIREKGYDADVSGRLTSMFAMAALICGVMASETVGKQSVIGGVALCAVLTVFNIIKRTKAVGIGNALVISLLQLMSMAWVCFAWVVKTIWGMFNGFTSHNTAVGTQKEKLSRDEMRKAQLLQEYEAKAAQAAGHSDLEAAAIAAVKKEEQAHDSDN